MTQRAVIVVVLVAVTFTTLIALAGHSRLTGPQLVTVSGTHGINLGDLLPLSAWAAAVAGCWVLWRHTK